MMYQKATLHSDYELCVNIRETGYTY